ncbi:U3 small nucleolar ribonucleoprotein MPP10 [Taenia crassiceps]|uniref:U3 small nucleolar ribonucleoprotein MPP10 n=1 Tax=Taenia crassiceps TaxID=6207 RepID=A0ABR4Q478_9CEST
MQFEKLMSKLDKEMDSLEEKMLSSKPWYLLGEVSGKDRSENALLEEHFEVQRHAIYRPGPFDENIITEFLKKGIREQSFDNPVLKVKPKERVSAPKDFINTKKTSLVEEYENLYIKAKALERPQEDPEKEALRHEIVDLFDNLDALSSMHFVPRKRVDGYNILTNKQAMALEEAGPTALAEGDLLAPEEVLGPRGEPLKGATEVTSTDRRRHRKKLMRVRAAKRKVRAAMDAKTKDQRVAMARVVKMAHKPGSNIKIAK